MRMEMTKLKNILIVCGIMGRLAFAQSESNELAPLTVNGGDTENAKIDKIGDDEPESDNSEKPEKDHLTVHSHFLRTKSQPPATASRR